MVQDNQTPILDLRNLETPADRPKVLLDSGEYPMLTGDDLGPVKARRISRLTIEFSELWDADVDEGNDVTDEQLAENLRERISLICPSIPEEELASMAYLDMLDITLFFRETGGTNHWLDRMIEIAEKYPGPSNGTS